MTWMVIRLILSLAFVGGVLWFAARLAKKRGLGSSNGVIEVVARQRMGRSSTVNVVRIADVVLVVGATEQQVTLLAEVDSETVEQALAERRQPTRRAVPPADDDQERVPALAGRGAHASQGALAGSVFDRRGWAGFVQELLSLPPGEVVELDRAASAPADLLVNGTLIARGEVVVVDEDFGLRISEIVTDAAAAELGRAGA